MVEIMRNAVSVLYTIDTQVVAILASLQIPVTFVNASKQK